MRAELPVMLRDGPVRAHLSLLLVGGEMKSNTDCETQYWAFQPLDLCMKLRNLVQGRVFMVN